MFPVRTLSLACALITSLIPIGAADDAPAAPDPVAAKLEKHRKKYGPDMLYDVDHEMKIIFVVGTDERTLKEVKQRLTGHAKALRKELFQHGWNNYLSVIIPRKWANPKVTGHFYPDWIDAATIGSNLMHEFTHALHYADQTGRNAYHPVWLMEGMASMYEDSKVDGERVIPLVNHRLLDLQQDIRQNRHLPLDKLLRLERRQFTSHHYAQARYVCMWLHASGKWPQWYAAYNAAITDDPSGVTTTEKIFNKSIAELTRDWSAWVLDQSPPKVIPGPDAAGLGIKPRQAPDGVTIDSLTDDGAAAKAGLAAGDTLLQIDGQRVIEVEQLIVTLAGHRAGDQVKLHYRRDTRYAETTATLQPLAKPPG